MKVTFFNFIMFLIIGCLFSTCISAKSKHSITVGVTEIPFLLSNSPEERGPYNIALDEIRASGHNVDVLYLPPARAEIFYNSKKISCLFPGSLERVDGKEKMIESNPLAIVHAYVFSLDRATVLPQLKAKRVAIRRGFSFGGIRKKLGVEFIDVESEEIAIQFLLKDRVDAIVSYLPDLKGAQKALDMTSKTFYQSAPVYSANEAFICHSTPTNASFVNDVNALFPLNVSNK